MSNQNKQKRTFRINRLAREHMGTFFEKHNVDAQLTPLDTTSSTYKQLLLKKLCEETKEAREAGKAGDKPELLTELGDVQEVIDTLLWAYGFTPEQIKAEQAKKRDKWGDYKAGLLLEQITVNHDDPRVDRYKDDPETPEIL